MTSASRSDPVERTRPDARTIDSAVAGSRIVQSIRRLRRWCFDGGLEAAFAASRSADYVETGRRWADESVIYGVVLAGLLWLEATLERWIKSSYGYRWLTAEPDPDVIVIDLRETKTVGPVLRLLERVLVVAIPAVVGSYTWRVSNAVGGRLRAEPLRHVGGGLVAIAVATGLWSLVVGSMSSLRAATLVVMMLVGLGAFRDRRSWAQLRETRPVQVLAAIFVPPEPPDETREREGTVNEGEQEESESTNET